jgi:hypothetical protein
MFFESRARRLHVSRAAPWVLYYRLLIAAAGLLA